MHDVLDRFYYVRFFSVFQLPTADNVPSTELQYQMAEVVDFRGACAG